MPIGKIVSGVMGALGAKKGSSSWEKKSFLTPEQEKLHKETLKGYSDLEYEGPGEYKSGQKADDLEGFKAKGTDELRSLQDEGNLSISGLDKLRNLRADSATRVNPDIKGMRDVAKGAWSSGAAHMDEVRRSATEQLQQADIRARRGGGGLGGTALARLGSRNVEDYGRTVGSAAARVAEQTAMQRQQLQLAGYGAANRAQMGLENLGLQGMQSAGSLQAQQNQMALQDLTNRRNIANRERQFGATHGLDVAKFSEDQAQNQNLWAQKNAFNKNQFALDRLSGMNTAATTQTFKNIKNVKKGSSGLGGALITGAGAVLGGMYGGPQGAAMGAQLGQGIVGGMGYDDGGGAMGQAISAGANMYGATGGFQNAGGMPPAGPAGMPGQTVPQPSGSSGGNWWDSMTNYGVSFDGSQAAGGRGQVLNYGPQVDPRMNMSADYNAPRHTANLGNIGTGYNDYGNIYRPRYFNPSA